MEPNIRVKGFDGDWEERSLGDIYTERNERGNDSLQILSVSIHDGVSDGELDEEGLGKVVRRSDDKSTYKHVYEGDLVFNMMRAWQGAIGVVKTEGMISPAYISAIPNASVYPPFMDYVLRRKEAIDQINNLSYGVTDFRKRLYWDSFVKVKCPLPSVEEQKRITDTLESLDRYILLNQTQCDDLKELKKYMLQKMFPKDGEKVPEIRFAGFEGEWEQRKFCDVAQRQSETLVSDDDNPCVEYEDVIAEQGILNKDVYSKGVYKNGIRFTSENVLYGKLRPYLHNWLNPGFSGVAVGDWWVLKPINTNKNFLFRLIQTSRYDDAANQSSGTKMPRADWNLISNMVFLVPASIEEQSEIAKTFDNLDSLITHHQRKHDTLLEFKAYLLQNMFPKEG